ncbi:MAG: glucuronyl hydrolase [Paenibacillus sp.]|nr:glucuronyl hydrolase [Paenibacillus sp.]
MEGVLLELSQKQDYQTQTQTYRMLCEFSPQLPLPDKQRVAFGWGAVAVDCAASGTATRFTFRGQPEQSSGLSGEGRLRICIACDVREEKTVQAVLAESGTVVGAFDIRYGYVNQPFELVISGNDLPAVMREGVRLRMSRGDAPLWMFYDPENASLPETHQPHLLVVDPNDGEAERLAAFYKRLKSTASIQPFGWLEGCVLDGLLRMDIAFPNEGWRNAIMDHLRLFFSDDNKLVIETHLGHVSDNAFYSHESTLPLAIIAQVWPDHPVIDHAIEYWYRNKHGLSTEGCYTLAYPIAVVAKLRNRTDLAELSVRVLLERIEKLSFEHGIWQQRKGFRNWARGYAWYMLGMTHSLILLRDMGCDDPQLDTIEREIKRIAELTLSLQRDDGLWLCYIDDATTYPDTSGSAGIAAALALGAKHGLIPDTATAAAERAFAGLQTYLTADGLLAGVAQNNRGGEALQRSEYRVISQMAMGLMGQLAAILGHGER